MDYVEKRATKYRELAQSGVICGTLRQEYGTNYGWTIECTKIAALGREAAKELVRQYLRETWEAVSITFFQKQERNPNKFYARFVSHAL